MRRLRRGFLGGCVGADGASGSVSGVVIDVLLRCFCGSVYQTGEGERGFAVSLARHGGDIRRIAVASVTPAARASRVDVIKALRSE